MCIHVCRHVSIDMCVDMWLQDVCLKIEGAMPGNDVCADIRHGSFNGMYGNGSHSIPLLSYAHAY